MTQYHIAADLVGLYERLGGFSFSGRTVLNVACGTGGGTVALTEAGARVVSTDLERDFTLDEVREVRREDTRLSFFVADATRLPVRSDAFDIVVNRNALEHVVDQQALLDECMRVVKPGGAMVLQFSVDAWPFSWWRAKRGIPVPAESDWYVRAHERGGWQEPSKNYVSRTVRMFRWWECRSFLWPLKASAACRFTSKERIRRLVYSKPVQAFLHLPGVRSVLPSGCLIIARKTRTDGSSQ